MHNLFRIKLSRHVLHFVVAALLLAYAGLFQHQATHYGGGETDCAECLAATHFGHALPSAVSALSLPTATEQPLITAVAGFISASIRYFSARAPPSFL
jgi:hypothetical protein